MTNIIQKEDKAMLDQKRENESISYIDIDGAPLEYVSIPSDVYSTRVHQQGGRSKHSHTCVEMSYVLSGTATHTIIQRDTGSRLSETIRMGTYYVLDHNATHLISEVSKDFFLINILFHPSFLNTSLSQYEPFDNVLDSVFTDLHIHTISGSIINNNYCDEENQLRPVFEKAWETYKKREPGYRNLLRCYISEILIQTVKKQIPKQKNKNHTIIDIRDYVNENYMYNISLTKICNERFLNPSFISRKFKEIIGVPFEVYLQNVRIQNACALLTETRLSIDEIIGRVGYVDGASFRTHFKRVLGTTPLRYRKMNF